MFLYGYETLFTYLISIVGILIVAYAQSMINRAYSKYKTVQGKSKLSGQEVARKILDRNGLQNVHIVMTKGELTDHYDPRAKVVRLSKTIFDGESIAAISVAAHECGHAIQDKENYTFMKIRRTLVPVVNFVTYTGYFVTIFALFAGMMLYLKFGIIMLAATLLFQLVTLPVEFDASRRAKEQLVQLGVTDEYETKESEEMLKAAAMTYVASLLNTVLNLIRLVMMAGRDND